MGDWIETHHGTGPSADEYRAKLAHLSEREIALYDALSGQAGNCPLCKGDRRHVDLMDDLLPKQFRKAGSDGKVPCSRCGSAHEALDMACPDRHHHRRCECHKCRPELYSSENFRKDGGAFQSEELLKNATAKHLDKLIAGNGDTLNLRCAFIWDQSPQGYDYWDGQNNHLKRDKPITYAARDILRTIRAGINPTETPE